MRCYGLIFGYAEEHYVWLDYKLNDTSKPNFECYMAWFSSLGLFITSSLSDELELGPFVKMTFLKGLSLILPWLSLGGIGSESTRVNKVVVYLVSSSIFVIANKGSLRIACFGFSAM